jgi:hypothetical protein
MAAGQRCTEWKDGGFAARTQPRGWRGNGRRVYDITVGYMGGEGEQWLLVRNERGEELLGLLGDKVCVATPGSACAQEAHDSEARLDAGRALQPYGGER